MVSQLQVVWLNFHETFQIKYKKINIFKHHPVFWKNGNGLNLYQKEGLILLLHINKRTLIFRIMTLMKVVSVYFEWNLIRPHVLSLDVQSYCFYLYFILFILYIYIYIYILFNFIFTFTFSYLADAFIQSDLQMRTMEAIKINKRAMI